MKFACASLLAFTLAASGGARAQETFGEAFWSFRATGGFDFSSGYYGASERTEILYLPATLQATKGPWTLKADVAWLRVTGPALLLDGSAEGTAGIRTSGAASGPGDINLYVRYSLEQLYDNNLFVDLTARVKAPTASFADGLGTGEWDQAFQVDLSTVIGKVMPFATLGYRFTGDPPGFPLRNVVYGTLGVQYAWSDRFASGVYYDIRQAAIRTAATPQEGTAYLSYKLSDRWTLLAYAVAGFSRNSPSAGGGGVLTYQW